MMDLIRLGDATDHGDNVISASNTMSYDGRGVARKGDEVTCPLRDIKPNLIIEGDEKRNDQGVPVPIATKHAAMSLPLRAPTEVE